jgi:hypothetical protein
MGYPRGIDHTCAFQFNRLNAYILEQSGTASEQDGHQVDMDFVKQSGLEGLLRDTRRGDGDILVPGGLLGLANGAFNPVGDEDERRSVLYPFLWDCMGNHKTRFKGGMAAPGPGYIEHSTSCYHCPSRFERLLKEFGALRRDLEYHPPSLNFKFSVAAKVPLKEMLYIIVRPSDKPIQRHGDPCNDFAHINSPFVVP